MRVDEPGARRASRRFMMTRRNCSRWPAERGERKSTSSAFIIASSFPLDDARLRLTALMDADFRTARERHLLTGLHASELRPSTVDDDLIFDGGIISSREISIFSKFTLLSPHARGATSGKA